MEVKPGYKQTEVGVIPEDWEITSLMDIGNFTKGKGVKKDDLIQNGFPCIRYGELYTHHNDCIKKIYSFIPDNIAKSSQKIKCGDILFAGSGETAEDIGKCATYLFHYEAYAGGDVIVFSPIEQNSKFLGYLLNCPIVSKQKARMGQGDAIVHISAKNLSQIVIPLPPLPEQTAIATALSDVDALISGLDRLIEKKRAIKQAAMQELLTGKRRLPGFDGEWNSFPLKRIIKEFIVPMRDKPKIFQGNIPWCRIEDFEGKYLLDSKSQQYVDKEIVEIMNLRIHPTNTVLVSCSANLGICAIVKHPLVTNVYSAKIEHPVRLILSTLSVTVEQCVR